MPALPKKPMCNVCTCGSHVWAPLTRWGVVLSSFEDRYLLEGYFWTAIKRGYKNKLFYAASSRFKRTYGIYQLHLAILRTSSYVDHINLNGLDCRRSNLRPATRSQNAQQSRSVPGSSSKYLGVWRQDEMWRAEIKNGKKRCYLGIFREEVDAALAYNFAAAELNREFASFNVTAA